MLEKVISVHFAFSSSWVLKSI